MFRTLLVLLFLAACGLYFHQTSGLPQPQTDAPKKEAPQILDDSSLKALKGILPPQLFAKDIQPALEQNKKEGLTSAQIKELAARLNSMGRELSGKASEAVNEAVKKLDSAMPAREKKPLEQGARVAGELAQKAGESLKESMPAIKKLSQELLSGMIAALSQILSSSAELLKK